MIDNGRNLSQTALNAGSGVLQRASFTTHVFSFLFLHAQKRAACVDLLGVELE